MTKPKLLDQVRNLIRTRHLSYSTEKSYIYHIRGFILFHGKRHPAEMSVAEIRDYLTHLAVDRKVAATMGVGAGITLRRARYKRP